MKKVIAMMLALVMFVATCGFPSMNVSAAEKSEKVTVYDGSGAYVGEFDSIEDFEREVLGTDKNSRSEIIEGLRCIAKIIMRALETYSIVETVSDISQVDINGLIGDKIVLPVWNGIKTFKLMSVSGGITNPYPPNSYQYSQFYKTNFYWVEI